MARNARGGLLVKAPPAKVKHPRDCPVYCHCKVPVERRGQIYPYVIWPPEEIGIIDEERTTSEGGKVYYKSRPMNDFRFRGRNQ